MYISSHVLVLGITAVLAYWVARQQDGNLDFITPLVAGGIILIGIAVEIGRLIG